MPLATEALRGEGAVLVNEHGERFMADVPGRELAPRDVVARAIFAEIARPGERVFLDARGCAGGRFADPLPGRGGAVPERRHRSRPRADPGVSGRALPHGRDQGGWARAQHACRACGPAARSPRLGCTGLTASPATRFSKRSPSQAGSRTTSPAPRWPARLLPRSDARPSRAPSAPSRARDGLASCAHGSVRGGRSRRDGAAGGRLRLAHAHVARRSLARQRLGGPAHRDGGPRPSGEPRGSLPQRPPEHDSRHPFGNDA